MLKKCLIICWYGKIPDYYELWKYSCKKNLDYDFFIFTDQKIKNDVSNIKIINMKFSSMKQLIEDKLNINVNFSKPYKLCDFRPAYGVIFEDYIREYDYWGHCDLDQFFGRISNFITDEIIGNYERINHNGHFVLYKNIQKINNLFKEHGSLFTWNEVFSNLENYAFDEYTGINRIVEKNSILQFNSNQFADIDKRFSRYKTVNHINYPKQIFVYDNGNIFRYIFNGKKIVKLDEFFYIHFQKKQPIISEKIDYEQKICIGSNKFDNISEIKIETFEEYNPTKGKIAEVFELINYYMKKSIEYFKSSKTEKIIKKKQKGVF